MTHCKDCGAKVVWQPIYTRQHATFTRRAWRMVDAGTNETHRCEERLIPCRIVDERAFKVAR